MNFIEKTMISIKISSNNKNSEEVNIDGLVNLKLEKLDVSKDDVFKFMGYRDYRAVICIFRLIYKNKTNQEYVYPIRISGKRSYDYYNNGKWNPDLYGYHIMNTICLNVQNLFLKYNTLDDEDEEISGEDFLLNQKFICKLSDEKYKKEIFKSVIEEVRINSN
jgi:hypothetical protein